MQDLLRRGQPAVREGQQELNKQKAAGIEAAFLCVKQEERMIHQYKLNGYNIVLDTCSGSIHVVDEVAYDLIAGYKSMPEEELVAQTMERYGHMEGVNEEEIRACLEDIRTLEAQGKLFSEDHFAQLAGQFKEKDQQVIKAMCLHVAHTCNLNCSYCFASQGKYHGERAL